MKATSWTDPLWGTIAIVPGESEVRVLVPHHPDFGPDAKALGGMVVGDRIMSADPWEWRFPLLQEHAVRGLCKRVYGHDGHPDGTVTCRIRVPDAGLGSMFWSLGRLLVYSTTEGVCLGNGVMLIRGGFERPADGIAVRETKVIPRGRTVLEVWDVPLALATEAALASPGDVDVVGQTDVADARWLLAEVCHVKEVIGWTAARFDAEAGRIYSGGKVLAEIEPGAIVAGDFVPVEFSRRDPEELHRAAKHVVQTAFRLIIDQVPR